MSGEVNPTPPLVYTTALGAGGGGQEDAVAAGRGRHLPCLMIMAKHTVVRPLHSMSAPICTHLSVFITAYGKHTDVYRSSLGPLTQWQKYSEGGRDVDNSEKVVLQTRVRDEGRLEVRTGITVDGSKNPHLPLGLTGTIRFVYVSAQLLCCGETIVFGGAARYKRSRYGNDVGATEATARGDSSSPVIFGA